MKTKIEFKDKKLSLTLYPETEGEKKLLEVTTDYSDVRVARESTRAYGYSYKHEEITSVEISLNKPELPEGEEDE